MKKHYSHILWDWNGTLFDDVGWCIESMNTMLKRREIAPLADVNAYHRVFRFPVENYYRNVGFDFARDSFNSLAAEYLKLYHSRKTGNSALHKNAAAVLSAVREKGIVQSILSASQIDNLLVQTAEFPIAPFFHEILGTSDIYAKSKIDIGLAYLKRVQPDRALLVGDTMHDFEVAQALGADCLLIARGHQSREFLLSCTAPVLSDIAEVLDFIA